MSGLDRDAISALTHAGVPFANPMSEAAIDRAIAALDPPAGARVLDVGCGAGLLLARIAAAHPGVTTVGVEPAAGWAATTAESVDEVHATTLGDAGLPPGSFDVVCCVASSHAFGDWRDGLRGVAGLLRPGGRALIGEGFWQRTPSAAYLDVLGGASEDELPFFDGLRAGALDAGLEPRTAEIASPADWAAYEETLIANGRHALETTPDPALRAWVDAAAARWSHTDGRDTLGFALFTLARDPDEGAEGEFVQG